MLLEVDHLNKVYGRRGNTTTALNDVSFTVNTGEFISIMGASGSGKTTLLNCISTIDNANSGKILLKGQDITLLKDKELASFRRNNLGFVFQESKLLDILTLGENIALPLTINKASPAKIKESVQKVASQLGIEQLLDKFPYEVSGGQKQRCAAARAIVNNPNLILADEPTGALDSKSAKMLLLSLSHLNEAFDSTILMVTHDAKAASYSNRILFIEDGNIYKEITKGDKRSEDFYLKIISVLSDFGGDFLC